MRSSRGPHCNHVLTATVTEYSRAPSTAPGCRVLSARQTNQPVRGQTEPPAQALSAAGTSPGVLWGCLPAERWLCHGSRGDTGRAGGGLWGVRYTPAWEQEPPLSARQMLGWKPR